MERQRILLTGGRAPATLDLARQFAQRGHSVFVAESVPQHLCRYSRSVQKSYLVPHPNAAPEAFADALLQIIQQEHIDLLIPTCEEIFFVAQMRDRLQQACRVFVASHEQMRHLHSKWEFIERARQYGLTVPETHLLTSRAALQHLSSSVRFPCILKPVFSRFATKVALIEHGEQLEHTLAALEISASYPWVMQEYLVGQAYCSYSLAHAGQLAAHAVYAVNFTAGRGACIDFAPVEQRAIDAWVTHFLHEEQFSGQIAFDFIVTPDGTVFPLECNPRATSGVHLFTPRDALPDAFFPAYLQCGHVLRPQATTYAMLGVPMLLYGLPSVRSWARLRDWGHVMTRAHDVIFAPRDLGPLLAAPRIIWYNWRESRRLHLSLLAFSTYDIEWNG